ncbi:7038_t:CDS:2, partial [Entrophospora sp. SA101]
VSESDKDDNSSYDVLVAEEEEEKYGDLEYLEKRHMLLKRIKEEKPMPVLEILSNCPYGQCPQCPDNFSQMSST